MINLIINKNEELSMLRKKFSIEKNVKNKAFYFIISHGLMEEYIRFSRTYQSNNPHLDCISLLVK